jgi:hypothetical protein
VTTLEELNAAAIDAIVKAERASLDASKAWEAVMVLQERIAKETADDEDATRTAAEWAGLAQRKAKALWEMSMKRPWEARHDR